MFAKSPPSSLQAWWAIWEFHSQHELRMPLKVGPEGWQPLWGLFLILLFPSSPCPSAGDHWGCRMVAMEPEIMAGLDEYPGLCVGMHSPAATSGAGLGPLTVSWGSNSQNPSSWNCCSSLGGTTAVTAAYRHISSCEAKLPGRVLEMGGCNILKLKSWVLPFH